RGIVRDLDVAATLALGQVRVGPHHVGLVEHPDFRLEEAGDRRHLGPAGQALGEARERLRHGAHLQDVAANFQDHGFPPVTLPKTWRASPGRPSPVQTTYWSGRTSTRREP